MTSVLPPSQRSKWSKTRLWPSLFPSFQLIVTRRPRLQSLAIHLATSPPRTTSTRRTSLTLMPLPLFERKSFLSLWVFIACSATTWLKLHLELTWKSRLTFDGSKQSSMRSNHRSRPMFTEVWSPLASHFKPDSLLAKTSNETFQTINQIKVQTSVAFIIILIVYQRWVIDRSLYSKTEEGLLV